MCTVNNLKFGDNKIMVTINNNNAWLQFNKLSIYCEASIRWFKFINTTVTLQRNYKIRVERNLKNVQLEADEIETLTNIEQISNDNSNTNHDDNGDAGEWRQIVCPSIKLNTKIIFF